MPGKFRIKSEFWLWQPPGGRRLPPDRHPPFERRLPPGRGTPSPGKKYKAALPVYEDRQIIRKEVIKNGLHVL